jgi:pimeloyl-ACP methyl ester carboxylesterase
MKHKNCFKFLPLLAFIFLSPCFAKEPPCGEIARSLEHFLKIVQEKQDQAVREGRLIPPRFYDFEADQKAASTWSGVSAPKFIQDLLLKDVTLIDHSLIGSTEPGVVKDGGSGEFVSLRIKVDGEETNMGVSRSALLNNSERAQKSFVRDSADAVIIFMHGGGTKTTGHHVVINLMNFFHLYGVDVISFDHAWHGEGSRKVYSSAREYMEWIRSLVRKTVPPGKKVFLAGHSMGGEFADTYRRLYPNDDLISGVIALSSVADPKPGASLQEKINLIIAKDEALMSENSISPEDKKLHEDLIKKNKISFPANLFESLFALTNSWVLPADGGKSLIPALYVWGQKDWLYLGNDDLIQTHIASLPHTALKLYGERYDFVDEKHFVVGHLLFDHHRPETKLGEAFLDIKEFIESVIGKKLTPAPKKPHDVLKEIVQTYINNLAFRQFADAFTLRRRIPDHQKMQKLNAEIASLRTFFAAQKEIRNDPDLTEAQKAEKIREAKKLTFLTESESAEEVYKQKTAIREGYFIPAGSEGDLGRQWVSELEPTKPEELRLKKIREEKRKELEDVLKSMATLDKKLETFTSPAVKEAEGELEKIFVALKKFKSEVEKAIYTFYEERLPAQSKSPDHFLATESLKQMMLDYENLAQTYQKQKSQVAKIRLEEIANGNCGEEARQVYIIRFGSSSDSVGSLDLKERVLRQEISELETQIFRYQDRLQFLEQNLVDRYSDGVIRFETIKLSDLLQTSFADRAKYNSFWQLAWSAWQLLWKQRPPVEKISFY